MLPAIDFSLLTPNTNAAKTFRYYLEPSSEFDDMSIHLLISPLNNIQCIGDATVNAIEIDCDYRQKVDKHSSDRRIW
jgi:hypothetical protein